MTLDEVRQAVHRISEVQNDPEAAHSAEDELYEAVLKEIAGGNSSAVAYARAALLTKDLDFPRWCA